MSDLSEFLRARLDEDESEAPELHERNCAVGRYRDFYDECMCDYPAKVLREVEAKRQLLGEVERELADDPTNQTAAWMARVLALPYAEHDDYRPAWRP